MCTLFDVLTTTLCCLVCGDFWADLIYKYEMKLLANVSKQNLFLNAFKVSP